jgi:hypothetical protein
VKFKLGEYAVVLNHQYADGKLLANEAFEFKEYEKVVCP